MDAAEAKIDPQATWEAKALKHSAQLNCCRFSPCGRFVLAAAYDATLQRWNLETDEQTALSGHNGWITALEFHPDCKRVFSVDTWGKLACWSYADPQPKLIWSVDAAHASWIRDVQISPDGRLLATCGNDQRVRLWSAGDGKPAGELAGHERHVYSLAFHPQDQRLASGDLLGVVRDWDLSKKKLVRELDASLLFHRPEDRICDAGGVRALAFSADGTRLVCSGISELKGSTVAGHPAAVVLDWKTGKQNLVLRPKDYQEVYKVKGVIIEGLRFHRDGFLVAVGGNGERPGAMWFWKLDRQDPLHELNDIPGSRSVDIHPDGTLLAVAQFEPNGRGINGGNGRKAEMSEYHSHDGIVRLYRMTPKPADDDAEQKNA